MTQGARPSHNPRGFRDNSLHLNTSAYTVLSPKEEHPYLSQSMIND